MEFKIVHELPGRIRLRTPAGTFSKDEAPALCAVLEALRGVERAQASHSTGSVLIYFERERRDEILTAVSIMTRDYYAGIEMPRRGVPSSMLTSRPSASSLRSASSALALGRAAAFSGS